MDKEKIERAVKEILEAIGEDPQREGLKETPKRVARMYEEVFAGIQYSNNDIAKMFGKCFDDYGGSDMVVVKDIPAFSFCEHHMALMYNMKISVGYIPHGKVIGLSKISRIADMVCRRLQLQERIGKDIAEIIASATNSLDVIVAITAEHSCVAARGIKKQSQTKTVFSKGVFLHDKNRRIEFLQCIE